MVLYWKAGWVKAASILLATFSIVAAVVDPMAFTLDPPKDLDSHRYWASHTPSENAPGWRLAAGYTLIQNNTKALVAGGYDDNGAFTTLHLYDIASGSWDKLDIEMNSPRNSLHIATFNNEKVQDLVVIMGGNYMSGMGWKRNLQILDMKTRQYLDSTTGGTDVYEIKYGGCTTWKDLFIIYAGYKSIACKKCRPEIYSNNIYTLNVTSLTWSQPNVTGDPLPFTDHANMVVVPNWKGRDTAFIYSTGVVFSVDLETWNTTMHETPTPGPKGEYGSSTKLVSIDPLGNRYFYLYGGGSLKDWRNPVFSSDLNVLRFEPELDWVRVPVRTNPQIQGSWMGILIGGLPQNMPAWIGEEPLVHMQGGQSGRPYVRTETHLMLGGISPINSIINPPTVNGSVVPDNFQVYAGDTIQFIVVPRSALGIALPYSGDQIYGFSRHMDGTERSCTTDDNVNGNIVQYIINCWVSVHGNYTFKIQIRGFSIVPRYQSFVQPAAVSVANSIAEGYGMQQANAMEVAIYRTKLYDAYGNRASVVSDNVRVAAVIGCYGNVSLAEAEMLDSSLFEQVDAVVTLNDPVSSLYTIEYIPRKTGVCKIQNLVNDVPFGNVTFVVVGDPAAFIAISSGEGATFMVLNILSCLAACAASFLFGIKAKSGYRDSIIFISGALALIGNLLYIGEPLDASCKARSAFAMVASGMLMGVMSSQTWWYIGYSRTPILAKQLPISPKRALKYAIAAICCEGLLILILQTTAPIHRSVFTEKMLFIGCTDATGNIILYAHLALLCFLSVISFLTNAHKAPDVTTSINSIMGYNLTVFALFLVGLIGILQKEDMRIFFVLQSLDIWIACMLTFGLVIYSKMCSEGKSKPMANIKVGTAQMQTLAVESTTGTENTSRGKSQMLALAQLHLRQDDLRQTTWKKCVYFHSNELAYGVIYSDFSKPGISLEDVQDITHFKNDKSNLRYGLRLKVNEDEKVLAFAKESDRDEYLEALKKIRVAKKSISV